MKVCGIIHLKEKNMYIEIIKIPKEYSNDYEIEQCYCGTKYQIPYFKCDENEGKFEFSCPICHTVFQMIQEDKNRYKIMKSYPNRG